jgi:hypothetical protein
MTAQLVASQEGLSSVSKYVSKGCEEHTLQVSEKNVLRKVFRSRLCQILGSQQL